MENFDFNELTKVSRRITRDFGDAPLSRTAPDKDGKVMFRLSQKAFDDLGLQVNSLQTFKHEAKKAVFLKVVPGNEGDFLKARGGKNKGKKFEHNELSESLTAVGGFTGNSFNLERIGSTEYYQILEATPAAGAETPAPKKERKQKAVPA